MGTAGHEQLVPKHWGIKRTFTIIAVGTVLAIIVSSVTVVFHFPVAVVRAP